MIRNVSLEEISDGKLYGPNDLVKADCNDCAGCSECCRGMGESIILDPLDVYRLTEALQTDFEKLLLKHLELHVVDGVILPNLTMAGENRQCTFLNEKGRCAIHMSRPGICRLFPLGRFYEGRSFRYFLQVNECKKDNRTKVKVKKWIDTPDYRRYEQFVTDWHYFIKEQQQRLSAQENMELAKSINLFVLEQFYYKPYGQKEDFYEQFYRRLSEAAQTLPADADRR